MADFETSASLSIELDQRELRRARREVEDNLNVQLGAGDMRGRGAAKDLVKNSEEQSKILKELVDQLQMGGGGGGGGGGGIPGGGGGGGAGGILSRLGGGAGGAAAGGALATGGAAAGGLVIAEQLARMMPGESNRHQQNIKSLVPEPIRPFAPHGLMGVSAAETRKTGRSNVLGPLGGAASLGASMAGMGVKGGLLGNGLGRDLQTLGDFGSFLLGGRGGSSNRDPAPSQDRAGSTRFPSTYQGLGMERGDGNNWDALKQRGDGNDWTLGGSTLERGDGNDWSLGGSSGGGGSSNVNVNVSSSGGPVEEGVRRAIEKHRKEIERNVQQNVEQKLSRQSGGFAVSGPGGRF